MKNKTLLLTKTLIKNGDGLGIGDNGRWIKVLLIGVMAAGLLPLLIMMMVGVARLVDNLRIIGQEGIVLGFALALSSVIIFIFGIFYIISSFYFSGDIESLLQLPLKPSQIVSAKFLAVLLYEYLFTALIYLPVMIFFGIKTSAGPLFYLYGLVIFAFVPVIPLAVASVLVMLIMRFTNVSKNKDIFKITGGVLAIVIGLSFNMILQRVMTGISLEELESLLAEGSNSLAFLAAGLFPSAAWAVKALIAPATLAGFLNLLLFFGVSAAVFALLMVLGERIYFKGVVGLYETGSKRHMITGVQLDRAAAPGSQFKTYAMTELKLLFRTPIYFLNCVLINFIWPIFFIFPVLSGSTDLSFLSEVEGYLADPAGWNVLMAGAFAMSLFLGGSNAVTPTAISREGQGFYIKKYLPMSYKTQLLAKTCSGFVLGLVSLFIMVIFAVAFMRLPLLPAMLILGTAWLGILATSLTGILIDLMNPKLKWNSEQQAVKQNMNVLYNMLLGAGGAALTIFAAIRFSIGWVPALLLLILTFGAVNGVLYALLGSFGVRRFVRLQG